MKPRRKEMHEPGHAHELTFSCYRRFRFLAADRVRQWLADAVDKARRRHDFQLWAYVVMPEHAHLLVYPQRHDFPIRRILAGIKLPVAQQAVRWLQANNSEWLERVTRRRGTRTEHLFWQSGGGYDRNVTSGETLLKMIDYIHQNPVRRRLVERARDWLWSSAAWFEGGASPIRLDPIPWQWLADTGGK
jgi:putative transposase